MLASLFDNQLASQSATHWLARFIHRPWLCALRHTAPVRPVGWPLCQLRIRVRLRWSLILVDRWLVAQSFASSFALHCPPLRRELVALNRRSLVDYLNASVRRLLAVVRCSMSSFRSALSAETQHLSRFNLTSSPLIRSAFCLGGKWWLERHT